jgi:hypothetical protein
MMKIKKIGTGAEGGAMGADHDGVSGLATVCLLRCSGVTNIRPDRGLSSNGTKAKRQSPVRGSALYRHVSGFNFCLFIEALPFIVPLNLAGGS